ncbi:hypothetical protein Psal006b_02609 [Piscirickettsia salmonis]|uniref:Transmission trait enhancer LetE n=1 Tax=Piscirickettsia salmonis TaxID=1238 RepID=A0A1L6T9F2_PISSA|nr:hypothetical protein [Piscirickettsia salmonis]AKP73135.1 hypothetical protein PSLF89_1120 [Piscirickettsia salmonis LF-89 = ATCC VR-1361]ALB21791.1 transmission trait enhancer LetE [Piscirickettsia salmonis]ALY01976.1 hypothetical protein AWE47_03060 [Piscirickettsia salmonis]AMA41486.1 hypothetical protein AWJ11_03050 [Piscirickettsia salmonis]AOS33972.1 hypothetical protein AVM72_00300 [Piscirickettsia salmonis]
MNQQQGELELLLHSQVTDYASEWMSGYDAAQNEQLEADNPNDPDQETTAFNAWTEGWWAGFYNEPPLYQKNAPVDNVAAARSQAANENSLQSNKSNNDNNSEEHQEKGFEKVLLGVGVAFACVVCYELVVTMVA